MENSAILTADILDIIFEGRNKEYGAYDLRKSYKKRMMIALSVMLSLILLMSLGYVLGNNFGKNNAGLVVTDSVILQPPPPPDTEKPPPPPPPPPPPAPPVAMKQFTTPIITDKEVKPEEQPPVVEDLADTKIGLTNQQGVADNDVVAPPIETGNKGIIETPRKADPDSIFLSVQIESEYPGGLPAWQRFLNRNLQVPQDAIDNNIQGTIVVQFIVDSEGNVSNVEALSGPEELKKEAVRVIRKSGKWTPAVQQGRHVKSYKRQPIKFVIGDQ